VSASLLQDELSVRTLIARYADSVNRRDPDDWANLWTEDGVAVVGAWSAAMNGFSFVFHVAHSGVVEVDGDRAKGRWTVSEQLVNTQGQPGLLLALYHDDYRREAGAWKIARRRLQPLYQGPPDLSGPLPPA
jgi:hypothetical protein